MFLRRFSLDHRDYDYAVRLIWRKPSSQNKLIIGEESSASSLRIELCSHLPLMCRWSKVVQFSVWPFDFPDFVGRALQYCTKKDGTKSEFLENYVHKYFRLKYSRGYPEYIQVNRNSIWIYSANSGNGRFLIGCPWPLDPSWILDKWGLDSWLCCIFVYSQLRVKRNTPVKNLRGQMQLFSKEPEGCWLQFLETRAFLPCLSVGRLRN